MRWIDVAGPPGAGKSTLCDAAWPPHAITPDLSGPPRDWDPFLAVVERLLDCVREHPSYAACLSMTWRSFAKMAAVHAREDARIYVQTGFAQRGLGIGWRLPDPEMIARYFELMPVSCGVVLLTAPVAVVQARNVARGKDRSYMVPAMQRPLEIAAAVLTRRGVPLVMIDTTAPITTCRQTLDDFAHRSAHAVHAGEA